MWKKLKRWEKIWVCKEPKGESNVKGEERRAEIELAWNLRFNKWLMNSSLVGKITIKLEKKEEPLLPAFQYICVEKSQSDSS